MKKAKSRKHAAFLALKAAGQQGLTLQQIVNASRELHPEWTPNDQSNLRTVRPLSQAVWFMLFTTHHPSTPDLVSSENEAGQESLPEAVPRIDTWWPVRPAHQRVPWSCKLGIHVGIFRRLAACLSTPLASKLYPIAGIECLQESYTGLDFKQPVQPAHGGRVVGGWLKHHLDHGHHLMVCSTLIPPQFVRESRAWRPPKTCTPGARSKPNPSCAHCMHLCPSIRGGSCSGCICPPRCLLQEFQLYRSF